MAHVISGMPQSPPLPTTHPDHFVFMIAAWSCRPVETWALALVLAETGCDFR